jgi:hypothetical protein
MSAWNEKEITQEPEAHHEISKNQKSEIYNPESGW